MPRTLAALALVLPLLASAAPSPRAPVRFAKPFLIGGHFAHGPRLPMAADFDGDGFADFACAYTPGGGILDVSVCVRGEKMRSHVAPARAFGADVVACAAGDLVEPKGADIVLLLADGTVRIAHGFDGSAMKVTEPIGTADARDARLFIADLDGDGGNDVLAAASGKWTVFLRRKDAWERIETQGEPACRAVARASGGVALIGRDGRLSTAKLQGAKWIKETLPDKVDPDAPLVTGDFDGDGRLDFIFDDLPASIPRGAVLAAADVTGDGADDLVCFVKDGDVLLYASYVEGAEDPDADGLTNAEEKKLGSDPLDRDTDKDGLLDGWEVRGAAGLDLAAEGFSPTRKDVICCVQRMWDVDAKHFRESMVKVAEYYATLGIGFHARFLPPLDPAKHRGRHWGDLGNENLPRNLWGIAHYMIVSRGGGGQAAEMGTMGGCGDSALDKVFIHEFGHQLGLGHTGGFAPAWCPIYRSLMNYAFMYLPGSAYSRGEFSSVTLVETDLAERLPFPYEKVKYLEGHSFRFQLKADGDGTLVDWNRNGEFDAGKVRADINTAYSTSGGERSTIGKTIFAPTFTVLGDDAWLLSVDPAGNLECRRYAGERRWKEPVSLGAANATSDPFAIGFDSRVWCCVPTKEGVAVLSGASGEKLDREGVLPDSAGLDVSAVAYRGELLVLLWSPKEKSISAVKRTGRGWSRSVMPPVKSEIPPGAAEDTISGQLLLGIAENKGRWRLVRLAPGRDGGFEVADRRWAGGEKSGWAGNRRPLLFFETGTNAGPEGRVHFIAPGMVGEKDGRACFYDAMTIGDRAHDDGWLLKKYYDEWTTTQSPVGGAWYKGDILLACRWYGGADASNDNLFVAHQGLGITDEPMSDFDDVKRISEVGLNHSILWMAPAK
ncbi:MAG: hypothetical protein HYY17_07780 [Planctomycetes bacterium]|nr:hypothetical protein [Planctomycetota bacterium]